MLSINHKSMKINIAPILSQLNFESWQTIRERKKKWKVKLIEKKKSFFISIFRELDKENGKWQTIDPVYSVPLPSHCLQSDDILTPKNNFHSFIKNVTQKNTPLKNKTRVKIQVSFPNLRQRKIFFSLVKKVKAHRY